MPNDSVELIADLKLQKPTTAERQIREIERNLFKGSGRAGEPLGRLSGKVSEFDKSLEAANARVIAFGASAAIITGVTTAITQMVVQSIKVEKTLLDINVLLNQSSSSLSKFSDALFNVAKNTGQSFFDVAEAAKEFSRQGLGVQETLSRTSDAMILTRLTGLDLVKSVEQLTASVNQFSKEGITTADVINRLANVDAKFAVSAKDLSEGLSRAGSVAQDAGASFNELIALVTAVQQRTARGGAVIGNALKTIFTRASRSDTLDQLEQLGIGVRDLEGKTLPTIRILSELSQKYDAMSSAQKAFTSELVGGGYQINIVKSLFDDLGRVVPEYAKALDVANQSSDEAYQRNELLNKSFASLANEAGQNLTKLAASIGGLAFGPALKNIFSLINGAGDSIDENSFAAAGAQVGKGLITGIGDFIGGPGLIYLTALIFKLSKKFSTFAKDSIGDVLSLGKPNTEILNTQKGINDLVNTEARAHDIVNNALLTQVQKEQQLIALIKEKVAAQAAYKNETIALSTSLVGQGVSYKPSTGKFKTRAGGHMPLPISSVPQQAIQTEIAGAKKAGYNIRASDVRVMRASIDGKQTTVVYNNKEKVIHDYMGSGEPAIIPPTGKIQNYPNGLLNTKFGKFNPAPYASIDSANSKLYNYLTETLGVSTKKLPLIDFSKTNKKYEGLYTPGTGKIDVFGRSLEAQRGGPTNTNRINAIDDRLGDVILHEGFHFGHNQNKKGSRKFFEENSDSLYLPTKSKDALRFVENAYGAKNLKGYEKFAVEEAMAIQFPKLFGYRGGIRNAAGGIAKTIYRGVNSKYGNTNPGAGSIGIANKLVATIGKGNYSDNAGIAKIFGDKTITQDTSKIKPSQVLQLSSYADVVGLYKKYEQRLPAGLASSIKNTTGAEQLGHIQNAGASLATLLKEDGYKMITSPFASGDGNLLSKRGLEGKIHIPLAGGYVNAALGLPLQTYNREELFVAAQKLGVKIPAKLLVAGEGEKEPDVTRNIAKFIGSSKQHQAFVSRGRRLFDRAGVSYSGIPQADSQVAGLATTRGFSAIDKLFDTDGQTPINRPVRPESTQLERKIQDENAYNLNPGYQEAKAGRYRTINPAQEFLGSAESSNPSVVDSGRNEEEQAQRRALAAQIREERAQKIRQESLARATARRAEREFNTLPKGVTLSNALLLPKFKARDNPQPFTGLGFPRVAGPNPLTDRDIRRNNKLVGIRRAAYNRQLETLRAESGVGFNTRQEQGRVFQNAYNTSVGGIAVNLRAQGIANPVSSAYQRASFLPSNQGGALGLPTPQSGGSGSVGGGNLPPNGISPAPNDETPPRRNRLSSLYNRATNFKNPEANEKFAQGGFALSFAAPLLGGILSETFGSKDSADQRSNRKIQGVASGIGSGAALGATLGGPLGLAVGGTVGAFIALKSITDNTVLSFDDLTEKSKRQAEASEKIISGISSYATALETLQSDSLDPNQRASVRTQSGRALSQLPSDVQEQLISAGTDLKEVQAILASNAEKETKKQANAELPKLLAAIKEKNFANGGLGQESVLSGIIGAGNSENEVDRFQLDKRLEELKQLSRDSQDSTFVGNPNDNRSRKQQITNADSAIPGQIRLVLESLGVQEDAIVSTLDQLRDKNTPQSEKRNLVNLIVGGTTKSLDRQKALTQIDKREQSARETISEKLSALRYGVGTDSLNINRGLDLKSIRNEGVRSRESTASNYAFSSIRGKLSSAEPFLSAPNSINLQGQADIAEKELATKRELSRIQEDTDRNTQIQLLNTKKIVSDIPEKLVNQLGGERDRAVGLLQGVGRASNAQDAFSGIFKFTDLLRGSTDADTKAVLEKMLLELEQQQSALKGINESSKATKDNVRGQLEVEKKILEKTISDNIAKKAFQTGLTQFNPLDILKGGQQFGDIAAAAKERIRLGLTPQDANQKFGLRYGTEQEKQAIQESERAEKLKSSEISAKGIIQEFASGSLLSPEEIAKQRGELQSSLYAINAPSGPDDRARLSGRKGGGVFAEPLFGNYGPLVPNFSQDFLSKTENLNSIEAARISKQKQLKSDLVLQGRSGITETASAEFSPFLQALSGGQYSTGTGRVLKDGLGLSQSISSQLQGGKFGDVEQRLRSLYPSLNAAGQKEIGGLIPKLRASQQNLIANDSKAEFESKRAAQGGDAPITIKFDKTAEDIIKGLAPKNADKPSSVTVPTTVSVTIQGNATAADGKAIGETVKLKVESISEFLSQQFGYAEVPKATA